MVEQEVNDRWSGQVEEPALQDAGKTENEVQVYVGFLPPSVDGARLSEMFAPFGEVLAARIVVDFSTQRSKGYGFVTFAKRTDAAKAAAQLHGQQLEGHLLVVRVSEENRTQFGTPGPVIYVKGIPVTYSEKNISDVFEEYGVVEDVKILTDRETRLSRGVALIRFLDADVATRAIKGLNRRALPGSQRILVVRYADTEQEKEKRRDRRSTFLQRRYEPYAAPAAPGRYDPGGSPAGSSSGKPSLHSSSARNLTVSGADKGMHTTWIGGTSSRYGHAAAPEHGMVRHHEEPGVPGLPAPVAQMQPGPMYSGAGYSAAAGYRQESGYMVAAPRPEPMYGHSGGGGYPMAYPEPPQASRAQRPGDGSSAAGVSIFVYNVPPTADDAFLYKLFGPHGAITGVEIARNRVDGTPRGFAFVDMVNQDDARTAIRTLDGQIFNGKSLQVSFKRPGRRSAGGPPPPGNARGGYGPPPRDARPAAASAPSSGHPPSARKDSRYTGGRAPVPRGAPR